jgi:transcription elongation GreA/GreB family factor
MNADPGIPSEVATMNSQVRVKDLDLGREFILVLSRDADIRDN